MTLREEVLMRAHLAGMSYLLAVRLAAEVVAAADAYRAARPS